MSFSFFKHAKRSDAPASAANSVFAVDMHAHVLYGLDNGPNTLEESVSLLRTMSANGIRKVIATPHIMGDFYQNSIESILTNQQRIERELIRRGDSISLDVAAEYYLDVSFMALLDSDKPLLTIADKYVLIETSLVSFPSFLWDSLKLFKQRKLVPVLAHPERYLYLQQNFELAEECHRRGILLQLNLSSILSTHIATRNLAERLITSGMVSFMGSNVHHLRDWAAVREVFGTNLYQQACEIGLLNNKLR